MIKQLKNVLMRCTFLTISILLKIYRKTSRLTKPQQSNSMKVYYTLIHSKLVLSFIKPSRKLFNGPLILHSNELESHVRNGLPEITRLKNVWFVPDLRAIYKDNGELIHSSVLKRGTIMCNIPPSNINVKQFTKTNVVDKASFGGIMLGKHYGHFLIESLSRLWPLAIPDMANDFMNCKILYWHRGKTTVSVEKAVIQPAQMILESLRIKSNINILGQPVYVSELLIPSQASIINNEFYSVFRDLLRLAGTGVILKNRQPQNDRKYPEKIYLSRTKLPYIRRNNGNEKQLENKLKKCGFEIIHPQELSLLDQICIFNKAKVIAGSFGSAFHTMLLADISVQKIICLVDDCPDLTSTGIDRICKAKTEYIRCMYPHPFCIKESGSGATKDKIIDVDRALDGILS